MDRNTELTNNGVPILNYDRSKHHDVFTHTTTFNLGQLVPFFFDCFVQPGDTYDISTSFVTQLTTLKTPIMGNLYQDIFYFSLPWWVVWEHAKEFFGENPTGAWAQTVEYTVPKIKVTTNKAVDVHSILQHMGWTTRNVAYEGTALILRAYLEVWNYWFRDKTVTAPILYSKGDADVTYDGSSIYGGTLLNVCRFHDRFSSCIPEPQAGSAEVISLGTSANLNDTNLTVMTSNEKLRQTGPGNQMYWNREDGANLTNTQYNLFIQGAPNSNWGMTNSNSGNMGTSTSSWYPNNLYVSTAGATVDLTTAVSATINALRVDVALQHIKEKDAIFGNYYANITQAHWGVMGNSDILQIAEYLGGKRVPLNITTVLQTSATDSTSPQGWATGYSKTGDADHSFTKSFTVHSIILGVTCIRQDHQYAQGLPVQFSKFRKYDYYWNELAGVGYQALPKKQLYITGNPAVDEQTFAYQQPWQEYRCWDNMVTGEMNPDYALSLDYWSLVDDYSSAPVFSTQWLEEKPDYLDRALQVQSSAQDQFLCDFAIDITKISEVPLYGIPGITKL